MLVPDCAVRGAASAVGTPPAGMRTFALRVETFGLPCRCPSALVVISVVQGGARRWDTATHRATATLSTSRFVSVAFSPDGRTVVGGIYDGCWLWKLP